MLFLINKMNAAWFVIAFEVYQKIRVFFYFFINPRKRNWVCNQPVVISGKGVISIDNSVVMGLRQSPGYLSSYAYIEARCENAEVVLLKGTIINNSVVIISNSESIIIGENCLVGANVRIFSSDFHAISKQDKTYKNAKGGRVNIGNNVLIGDGVIILKGVTVGDNSIIGAGSVVTKPVPANCIVAGNPARVIRFLE